MKEVKFRAYDERNKEMRYSDKNPEEFYIDEEGIYYCYYYGKRKSKYINRNVMQYMGLKDKGGEEIYEGDIVLLRHWKSNDLFDYNKPFVVEWDDGQINFKQNGFNNFIGSLNGKLTIKVIGNIYDNPELMEDK